MSAAPDAVAETPGELKSLLRNWVLKKEREPKFWERARLIRFSGFVR